MFSNHPPLNDVNASKKRGKKSEIEREILEVGADEYEWERLCGESKSERELQSIVEKGQR